MPQNRTANERIALAILLALCAMPLSMLWFRRDAPAHQEGSPERVRPATTPGRVRWQAPAKALKPAPVNVDVSQERQIRVPVRWIGLPLAGRVEVPLIEKLGSLAASTVWLAGDTVELPVVPDGTYRFDFAAAGIYSIEHELRVSGGEPRLFTQATCIDGGLPVSRAVRVTLTAEVSQAAQPREEIMLRWRPLGWPTQQSDGSPVYSEEHAIVMLLGATNPVLVPAAGCSFQVDSDDYSVKAPTPHQFLSPEDGSLLRIIVEPLIHLMVDLVDPVGGRWPAVLQGRGAPGETALFEPSRIIISVNAILESGWPVEGYSHTASFTRRASEARSAAGIVDSFTLRVPRLLAEGEIQANLRIHGGRTFAWGSTRAGPDVSAIRVLANIAPDCRVTVTVVDSHNLPVTGIEVVLAALRVWGQYRLDLAYTRAFTDDHGVATFGGIPSGQGVYADIFMTGNFNYESGRIELNDTSDKSVTIALREDRGRMVSVRLSGRVSGSVNAVVLEGDGKRWFRLNSCVLQGESMTVPVSSDTSEVLVAGRTGNCIFCFLRPINDRRLEIEVDFDSSLAVTGNLPGGTGGTLFPYAIDSPVAWGAALAAPGECLFPVESVGAAGSFSFKLLGDRGQNLWVFVSPAGEVHHLCVTLPSPPQTQVALAPASLVSRSTLEVTAELEKLPGCRDFVLLICPVFEDSRRALEANLQLAVRVKEHKGGFPSVSLPLGTYVVILSYVDKHGAQRLNPSQGMFSPFESRPNLTTKVHLPVR